MKTVQHTLVSRPIEMDDGEAVADILNAFFDDIGRSGHFTGDNVRGRLQTPTLNRETHTRLIVADGGQPFGYAFLWKDESGDADARLIWVVHPANRESNAGAMLLRWAEQQVLNDMQAATSTAHCRLQAESLSTLDGSQELYHQFGYRVVRNFWVMKIELETEPSMPVMPSQVHVRSFDPKSDAEKLYCAIRSAFADHWGYQDEPFEDGFPKFSHEIENDPNFNPSLWYLLVEGDAIVGMALCKQIDDADEESMMYISRFGISPMYRRQGIGLALLQYVFCMLYQRDCKTVILDVDAANVSGATRLYRRAGMSIDKQWRIFEKLIRIGQVQ